MEDDLMKPILYRDYKAKDVVGSISDAYNQSVHEVLNGEYTATFTITRNSKYFKLVKPEMFVRIAVNANDSDIFIITKTDTKNPGTMTVTCNQITMMTNDNYMRGDLTTDYKTASAIISEMRDKLDLPSQSFTYSTDISKNAGKTDVTYSNQNPGQIMVGANNSLASIFNGRIVRKGNNMKLTSYNTGNSIDLRRGKNISGVYIEKNIDKLTTSIVGWFTMKDTEGTTGDETHVTQNHKQYSPEVNSPYKGKYNLPHRKYIDYSSRVENIPDLIDVSKQYFKENPGIDLPTYTITIDSAGSNSKRAKIAEVGDTARIYDPDYDLTTEQTVTERTFDPDKMINTSLKAGTVQQTIFRYLDKRISDANKKADDNKAQSDDALANQKDDINKIFDETNDKIDDVNDLTRQQKEMLKNYQKAVTEKVQSTQRDITNFMNSGGNNKIRWIPTLAEATQMEITTPYGYLLIDDHGMGFHKNNGTVITGMSADGRFYADKISTQALTSVTITGATINGGQINGVNIGSVGSIYTTRNSAGYQTVINSTNGISTPGLNMGTNHGNINNVGTLTVHDKIKFGNSGVSLFWNGSYLVARIINSSVSGDWRIAGKGIDG